MRALRDMPSPANIQCSLWIFYDLPHSRVGICGESKASYSELLVPIILDKLFSDNREILQENI